MKRAWPLVLLGALIATTASAQPQRYRPDERILITSFDAIAALASDSRGIWTASDAGIGIFDFGAGQWLPPLAPLPGWPIGDSPSALAHDPFGDRLWLGTEAGVLLVHAVGDDRWERPGFAAGEPILRIVPDSREAALWVGTPSGWYRVRDDGRSGRFLLRVSEIPPEVRQQGEDDPVLRAVEGTLGVDERLRRFPITGAVTADGRPERYVGTDGGGLLRFDPRTLATEWLPLGTLSRGVAAVAAVGDRIWFGGDGRGPRDGVASARRDLGEWVRFEAGYEGAPRGHVARVAPAGEGLWFAASDGAFHLPADAALPGAGRPAWRHITSADGLPADQTTAVLPLNDDVWIATLRGLARADRTGRVVETLLVGRRVLDVALVGDEVWSATDQGLFRSPPAGGAVAEVEGAPPGLLVAVAGTPTGAAILTPDGLYRLENGGWRGIEREPAARLGALLRLVAAVDGTLWVGAERGVGARHPDGRWRWWRVPEEIPAGPVRGLAVDGDHLWAATPAGAVRLDLRR